MPLFVPSLPQEGREDFLREDIDIIGELNPKLIES